LLAGMSNLFSPNTNAFNDAGITNAVNNFHADNTNALWNIYGRLTNHQTFEVGGLGTNYGSAEAIAESATATFNGQADTFVGSIGTGPDPGGGSGSPVSITIGAVTADWSLMPGEWATVWEFARGFMAWILVASFLTKIAVDSYRIVQTMAEAKQLSFPNINIEVLGTGGNYGLGLAPILLIAILTLFGAALGFFGTYLGSLGTEVTTFGLDPTSGFGGAVANGIAFLKQAVPLSLVFGLPASYIVFRILLTKATALLAVAVRALIGS